MPDYANAKIYKIVGEDGSTYYGSTVQSFRLRKNEHLSYKGTMAHQKIISQMDWDMILIENYPCESKKELEQREAWYIRENPCVNRCIPGRTKKEYYEDHREKINSRAKKHYQENHEHKHEYDKIRHSWIYSFGGIKYENNLQRCDPSLFQ